MPGCLCSRASRGTLSPLGDRCTPAEAHRSKADQEARVLLGLANSKIQPPRMRSGHFSRNRRVGLGPTVMPNKHHLALKFEARPHKSVAENRGELGQKTCNLQDNRNAVCALPRHATARRMRGAVQAAFHKVHRADKECARERASLSEAARDFAEFVKPVDRRESCNDITEKDKGLSICRYNAMHNTSVCMDLCGIATQIAKRNKAALCRMRPAATTSVLIALAKVAATILESCLLE